MCHQHPQKKHILIVDDEPNILEMLSSAFASGHAALTATHAEQALQIMEKDQGVELLIADISLPGISGLELLQISRELRPDVPVVIITASKALDAAITAIRYGARDYITKPFVLKDIRETVEKILQSRGSDQKEEQLLKYTRGMEIRLEVPSRQLDADDVADRLATFLSKSGFCTEGNRHQLRVAFTEVLTNALEHGNLELSSAMKGHDFATMAEFESLRDQRMRDPGYGDRLVRIGFRFTPQRFWLSVSDQGPGFDWRPYVRPDARGNETDTCSAYGRGFLFIRHIIDTVHFNETGNTITLVKSKSNLCP